LRLSIAETIIMVISHTGNNFTKEIIIILLVVIIAVTIAGITLRLGLLVL
jgi:hypothetical protein